MIEFSVFLSLYLASVKSFFLTSFLLSLRHVLELHVRIMIDQILCFQFDNRRMRLCTSYRIGTNNEVELSRYVTSLARSELRGWRSTSNGSGLIG